MRVFKSFVINMETLEIEQEVFYEYNGSIALCCGPGDGDVAGGIDAMVEAGLPGTPGFEPGPNLAGVGSIGGPSSWETTYGNLADESNITSQMTGSIFTILMGSIFSTSGNILDTANAKNTAGLMARYIANRMSGDPSLDVQDVIADAFNQYGRDLDIDDETIAALTNKIGNIFGTSLNEMAEIAGAGEGGLSEYERGLLDEMQQHQLDILIANLQESYLKEFSTDIAHLVDRGVLEGTIGTQMINELQESYMESYLQGFREIRGERLASELTMWAQQKGIDLERWKTKKYADMEKYRLQTYEDAADAANKWGAFGNVLGGFIKYLAL